MKKIVFILPSVNSIGGAQKMAKFVVDNSLRAEENRIYIIPQQKCSSELAFSNNIDVVRLKNNINASMPRTKRKLIRLLAMLEIRKIIKKISPDLVCVFGITSSALLAISHTKCKKVYCERGDPFSYPDYLQKILKKHLFDYQAVVFQTDNAKKFFSFIDDKKMFVIPNPCIVTKEPIVGGNFHSNILVSAGRLVEEKRFDFIIKAFSKLIKKHPDLILKIYGDGEEKSRLANLVEELGLRESIFLNDGVENITEILSEAKLFLFASRFEGVPNVVIETCSMGIPCVCTNCSPGGVDFLTIHGTRGGRMVENDDFDGFVKSCFNLMENKKEYESFSISGIAFRDRFDSVTIAKKWQSLFEKI